MIFLHQAFDLLTITFFFFNKYVIMIYGLGTSHYISIIIVCVTSK